MQPAFAARILRGAKELGVHTALDTSGYLGANATDAMLDDTDLVLLDVKAGTSELYKRVTGRELEPTLEFGRRLARARPRREGTRGVDPLRARARPHRRRRRRRRSRRSTWHRSTRSGPAPSPASRCCPFHQMGRSKWEAIGRDVSSSATPSRRAPSWSTACGGNSAPTGSSPTDGSPDGSTHVRREMLRDARDARLQASAASSSSRTTRRSTFPI